MLEKLIFGPPGCGKTYRLINVVRDALKNGTPPDRIGFVSFSRKAVEEARLRVAAELNLTEEDTPWFRTLHSTGFQWLGFKKEQVMSKYDYGKIGSEVGLVFDNNTARNSLDGLISLSAREGNKYLEIIHRSIMRCVSLEQQFSDTEDYDLHWSLLKKLDAVYNNFKKENDKVDFTDMIKGFVKGGTAPFLDLLIVDEAQDLTPLQWKQINVMKENTKEIWYAGDDDQCIHRWNGVSVTDFIRACDNIEILNQSYRVPTSVFSVANRIVKRISYRQPKNWHPVMKPGSVNYHLSMYDVDIDQGSWTIMARTNRIVQTIANSLREDGYLFNLYGSPSLNQNMISNMKTWELLQKGSKLPLQMIKDLYAALPKMGNNAKIKRGVTKQLDFLEHDLILGYDDLVNNYGMIAPKDTSSRDMLSVSKDDRFYMDALTRRGEDFESPRIDISTIHAMKGGEDDNIMVMSESSRACVRNKDQDDEHRVFYTGVTRTKENLHIIETGSEHRYQI
jgi:superfamily I DNA/RNA helicase